MAPKNVIKKPAAAVAAGAETVRVDIRHQISARRDVVIGVPIKVLKCKVCTVPSRSVDPVRFNGCVFRLKWASEVFNSDRYTYTLRGAICHYCGCVKRMHWPNHSIKKICTTNFRTAFLEKREESVRLTAAGIYVHPHAPSVPEVD